MTNDIRNLKALIYKQKINRLIKPKKKEEV